MKRALDCIVKIVACTLLSMLATSVITIIWAIIDCIPDWPSYMVYMSRFDRFISEFIDLLPTALLFGLFISPSIIIYYGLVFFRKSHKAKTIGYVLPIVGWGIYLVACIILDAQRQSSEGAGEMATVILINDFIAGAVVYVLMSKVKWLQ